ncbi:MAG TPA: LysM peptidoglycan-binding domain-containing protein [Anaerolineae bacterium]|nr:LysM peptidoglycan-binding domain-containing protein [Anaerolineae bacterium]
MDANHRASICSHCGMAMQEGQRICPGCGKAQRPAGRVRCRHCGTLNLRARRTCTGCDLPLRRVPAWALLAAIPALAAVLAVLGWIVLPRLLSGQRATDVPPGAPTQAVAAASTATDSPSVRPSDTTLPAATAASTAPAPTSTPSPTATATRTAEPTATESPTATRTPTSTPTRIPSRTPTSTPTETPTATATSTEVPTETPTAEPSPSTSASPTPFVYTVKSGDNLYTIAQNFDVTVDAIMAANNLTSNRLRVGQQLIIPLSTPTPSPTP